MHNRRIGIVLSYISTFINMFSGLFLSVFLLKCLGGSQYGVYQTVASLANYLVLFEFGTGTVMTRNISLCRGKDNDMENIYKNISTIWYITIALSILISLISVIFFNNIGVIYRNSFTPEQIVFGKKIFIFVAAYLVVSFLNQSLSGLLLAFEKYTLHSSISVFRVVIRLAVLVALIINIPSAVCIAVVDMVLGIIICVVEYAYCRKKLKVTFSIKYFDWSVLRSSLPLCIAIFLQTVVNQANNNVDKFIIGVLLTPDMVTLYSISLFVFSMFSSMTSIPISMYSPQITKVIGAGVDRNKIADIMIVPSRIIIIIGGMILFGFIASGRQFIHIAYGEEYIEAWIIAVILMTPMFFNMSNGIIINVLNAENKRMTRSLVLIVTTILNIILTCILINIWGVVGAAIATAVTTILGQLIIMNVYYYKCLKIPIFYMLRKAFKGILLWQVVAAIIAFFCGMIVDNVYASFVISGSVFVIVFGVMYIFFGATANEKAIMRRVLRRKK